MLSNRGQEIFVEACLLGEDDALAPQNIEYSC